jgi:hypothetical protein
MTQDELISAVQAQAGDFTAPFKDRIIAALPLGIAIFAAEYQWEFLDIYTTATTALDATTGKYKISLPSDFFKPVALSTALGGALEYQNRIEWLEEERVGVGSDPPIHYTVIGTTMFLHNASGTPIEIIYTRNADGITLADLPGQYHPAIVQAVVMWLMPAVVEDGAGHKIPNPLYDAAKARYNESVSKAAGLEAQSKGRPRTLDFSPLQKLRSEFDR